MGFNLIQPLGFKRWEHDLSAARSITTWTLPPFHRSRGALGVGSGSSEGGCRSWSNKKEGSLGKWGFDMF